MLETHRCLSLCADSFRFPSPKIFTNALLHSHDITALIRDTEDHERALFQIAPPVAPNTIEREKDANPSRRSTIFPVNNDGEAMVNRGQSSKTPRKQSAVAKVLGREMMKEIEKSSGATGNVQYDGNGRGKGEVNMEVLLRGAEKLCSV